MFVEETMDFCVRANDKTYCLNLEDSLKIDRSVNGDITDKIMDNAFDVVAGIGDTASALIHFPEDVAKYTTCTDRYLGERMGWGNIGSCEHWYQPVINLMDTANSMVYGGFDLLLAHIPYKIFNGKFGINVPYFTPFPVTTRGLSADLSMVATIFAVPSIKQFIYKKAGIISDAPREQVVRTEINDIDPKDKVAAFSNVIASDKVVAGEMKGSPEITATVQSKAKGLFNRLLDLYQKADEKYHYLTGAATAGAAYVGGDIIAQLILSSRQPFDPVGLATLLGLSLYYGWETPLTLAKIDSAIKIGKANIEPHIKAISNGLKGAFAGKDMSSNLKLIGREIGQIATEKKGEIMRPLAYMAGISPFWTMRHMAILNMMHGIYASPFTIVSSALATWVSTTPVIYGLEYVIQNKIPLRYRFLAQASVIASWHTIASLVTLLE